MKYKSILLITICIHFIGITYSQTPPIPNGPPCWPPPCIPIDGGIGIFTLLAAFFGYKFYKKSTN